MADGKWITGLTADAPAEDAARAVLEARLGAVRDRLRPAAEHADQDVEHVHQLRVATRRAGAALRIFRPTLPKDDFRDARSALRAVRQSAGAARDWDVFLAGLDASPALAAPEATPAKLLLAGYALGERAAAQDRLAAAVAEHGEAVERLAESVPEAARPPRGNGPRTTGDLAAEHLGRLFERFAEEVAAGPAAPEQLHELRITAKRVRYAMEVFADLYAAPFRDVLYPAVEAVQELLGGVQDGHVALARLAAIRSRLAAVRPSLAEQVGPGFRDFAAERWDHASRAELGFRDWVRNWRAVVAEHPLADLLHTTPPVTDAQAG